jgi:O-antigen/teichoic acid export membrane protein
MTGSPLESSLARRGLFGLALQFALRLRGLILIPIVVRALSPSDVGVLNLGTAFLGWLAPLLLLGLNTGFALRLVHLRGPAVRPAVLTVLVFSAATSLLGAFLVLFAIRLDFLGSVVAPLAPVLIPIGLLAVGTTLREVAIVFPQVRQDLRFVGRNSLLADLGGAVAAIGLVLSGFGVSGALLGPAAFTLAAAGLAISYSVRRSEGPWSFDHAFLREALRSARPVLPLALALWALQSSDYFFVSHFQGTAALAIYGLAYNLASPALMGIAAMNLIYLPTCVEILGRGRVEFARFIDSSSLLFALAGISAISFSIVAGPAVTTWFAGAAYAESGYLLPIVVAAYVMFSLGQLQQFVPGAMTQDLSGAARAHAMAALFSLTANFIVVPRYGYWGAAVVTFASYCVALVLMVSRARVLLPEIAWPRTALRLLLLAGVSITAALLLRPFASSVITGLTLGLLSVAVVAGLALTFGLLRNNDLARLGLVSGPREQ